MARTRFNLYLYAAGEIQVLATNAGMAPDAEAQAVAIQCFSEQLRLLLECEIPPEFQSEVIAKIGDALDNLELVCTESARAAAIWTKRAQILERLAGKDIPFTLPSLAWPEYPHQIGYCDHLPESTD